MPVTPVQRHLPTEEATRAAGADPASWPARSSRRRPRPTRRRAAFPARSSGPSARPACSGCRTPRSTAAAGSPTRSTSRSSRSWRAVWATVAEGVSVHTLACYPLAAYGTDEQRDRWLPDMIGGELLGALLPVRGPVRLGRRRHGHPRRPGRRRLRRRTGPRPGSPTAARPTSTASCAAPPTTARVASPACWSTPAPRASRRPSRRRRWASRRRPTAQVRYDDARIAADRLLGAEGQGFKIALAALDGGRLGIAAVAVGLAQAAFDTALAWAEERQQFGRPIVEFQGVGFLLADMATGIEAGRALYARGGSPPGPRRALRQAGRHGEAVLHRHGHGGHHRRRPGARRLRLRRRTSRSSGTSARPRCCRSSRAPTRSSGWSSPATSLGGSSPLFRSRACRSQQRSRA